eukprot:scaffold9504_cov90-Isochrysis_galbana.AAC.1
MQAGASLKIGYSPKAKSKPAYLGHCMQQGKENVGRGWNNMAQGRRGGRRTFSCAFSVSFLSTRAASALSTPMRASACA